MLSTLTPMPLQVALLGIVVYVAAALAAVGLAAVVLLASAVLDASTRRTTRGLGAILVTGAVVLFAYSVVQTSLDTALSAWALVVVAVAVLWLVPVAVATGVLSLVTDAAEPLRYAVAGWPVGTILSLAYLRVVQPPSTTPTVTVVLFGVPVLGAVAVGYAVRLGYVRVAG